LKAGRPTDAVLALQDCESRLRGDAEVHAALAALLYAERTPQVLRAEQARCGTPAHLT
jgi:hypothetical protein